MAEPRVCWQCVVGWHQECRAPKPHGEAGLIRCCCPEAILRAPEAIVEASGGRGSDPKRPDEVTDVLSTGRKRAAMLAPIFRDMTCEWSGLKFAGGGVVPIIGCDGNLIQPDTKAGDGGDLHHGPDKNTLNNAVGTNLHRICKSCHHAWHAANDVYYGKERPPADQQWLPEQPYVPHDPITQATPEELEEANKRRKQINKKQADLESEVDLL